MTKTPTMQQCKTCGKPRETANYAYHVCVSKRFNGKTYTAILGAIEAAIYHDYTSQYSTRSGSAVIMSARRYRELINEKVPNGAVDGVPVIETITE